MNIKECLEMRKYIKQLNEVNLHAIAISSCFKNYMKKKDLNSNTSRKVITDINKKK